MPLNTCSIDGFRAYYSWGSNKNGGIAVFINENTIHLSLDFVNIIDSCDSLMHKTKWYDIWLSLTAES